MMYAQSGRSGVRGISRRRCGWEIRPRDLAVPRWSEGGIGVYINGICVSVVVSRSARVDWPTA